MSLSDPHPLVPWLRAAARRAEGLEEAQEGREADSAEQSLGLYAAQAEEIRELLDTHAPFTIGNLRARIAQLCLLIEPPHGDGAALGTRLAESMWHNYQQDEGAAPADHLPAANGSRAGWWCPQCQCEVPPAHVTYEETHDPREGGCGAKLTERTFAAVLDTQQPTDGGQHGSR